VKKVTLFCAIMVLLIPLSAIATNESWADNDNSNFAECCYTDQALIDSLHNILLEKKNVELQHELGIEPYQMTMPGHEHFTLMPSTGNINMLVLPITYKDQPQKAQLFNQESWKNIFFGAYNASLKMYEQSFRGFFYQSSYGKLDISGTVLPAYKAPLASTDYEDFSLKQQMITDALTYFCEQDQIDISQFDNDGDNIVDALIVCELKDPASSLTGVLASLSGTIIDGFQVNNYAHIFSIYQEDLYDMIGSCIHETGHLLGLPDNYGDTNVIDSGLYELMAGGRYINTYYKYLLDWIEPTILTNADTLSRIELEAVDLVTEDLDGTTKSIVLIPDIEGFPFAEYYVAEYRSGGMMANPKGHLTFDYEPGIVLWHCNTYVNTNRKDKPYINPKNYLKPVYKSETEKYREKDVYIVGDVFSSESVPNSNFYDGVCTGAYLKVEEITPHKAIVLTGFQNSDLEPGPVIEISHPTQTVIRKGETSTIELTVKAGDELLPIDTNSGSELANFSVIGDITSAGVSTDFSKNPVTIKIFETWFDAQKDGIIWLDIPAGAIRYNGKNSAAVTSEKIYVDNTPPEITLLGENPLTHPFGETYTDPGAVATDNLDPNIAEKLKHDASGVNPNKAGTYTVTYSVEDHAGHTATVERKVVVEAHTHSNSETWSNDEGNHWRECSVCHDRGELGAHTEDGGRVTKPPTEEEEGLRTYSCSTCGYEMRTEVIPKLEPSHTHSYPESWSSDETGHWHECECGEKAGFAAHVEDNGIVTRQPTEEETGLKIYSCTTCGYEIRTETIPKLEPSHTHEFSTAWSSDGTDHWHECDCGEKADQAAHTWDGGKVTIAATSTKAGVRTYTCTVCAKTRTETIPATGGGSSSGSGSSGGGGGGSVAVVVEYTISLPDKVKGGSVKADLQKAAKGKTVTLSVETDPDYELEQVMVRDKNGKEVTLAEGKEGRYTFIMPAADVEVSVSFREKPGKVIQGEPPEPVKLPFADVAETAWYYEAVRAVYEQGIMTGMSETQFAPEAPTSRGMVVTMLYRMEGEPVTALTTEFTDVPSTKYYAYAVSWAAENGIVTGYGDGTFRPDASITREQMAAILYRYAEGKGWDTTQRSDLFPFIDWKQITPYARSAMSWAKATGLLNGTDWGGIDPGGMAGRGQIAVILNRFLQ
jgi:M6 family metalloprotease-like protein